MRKFRPVTATNNAMNVDTPLQANHIRDVVKKFGTDAFCFANTQQDAEEFLGCLVNGMNDEMLKAMALVRGPESNRLSVSEDSTPLSDIFMGRLRSKVHRIGDSSSETLQPFLTLPLNIEVSRIKRF